MRCYGNVRGRTYRNSQSVSNVPSGNKICPSCRKPRPCTDFINGGNGSMFKTCRECRMRMRKNKSEQRKRNREKGESK